MSEDLKANKMMYIGNLIALGAGVIFWVVGVLPVLLNVESTMVFIGSGAFTAWFLVWAAFKGRSILDKIRAAK